MNMRRSLVSRSNTAKLRQRYKTHKEYDRLMNIELDAILNTVSSSFSFLPNQYFIPIDQIIDTFCSITVKTQKCDDFSYEGAANASKPGEGQNTSPQ